MLIRINGGPATSDITTHAVSYLDVADELLNADGHHFKSSCGSFGSANALSPVLPEDFFGFNIDAFLDRVSMLAMQV